MASNPEVIADNEAGIRKKYSESEVAKHNTRQDLWMSIHGRVYDVTEYAKDHPGGIPSLTEVAGTDATGPFEDIGHTEDAREILQAYLIGELEGYKAPVAKQAAPTLTITPETPAKPQKKSGGGVGEVLAGPTVPLAAVTAATVGLFWAANYYKLIPTSLSGGGSLGQGLILGAVSLGLSGFLGVYYLENSTNIRPFTSYDHYVQSSIPQRGSFYPAGVLSPQGYQKLRLGTKKELSPGIWQFVFELPHAWSVLGLPIGQHVAIKGEINGQTVVRSYTPVSNNRDLGRLELLIRVYPGGLIGNYLKDMSVGSEAEFRGPKGAMKYRKGLCKSIGMVAGGTGITPMFQVIRAICEEPTDDTQISLIYANRTEGDILLRGKLDAFTKTGKLKVYYTLDEPTPSWQGGSGRVTQDLLAEHLPKASEDVKIMLCGPPGMIAATKNSLANLGFQSPGAVSKATDQVFCF